MGSRLFLCNRKLRSLLHKTLREDAIIDSLQISPNQKEKVDEAYKIECIGEHLFYQRKHVREFFSSLENIRGAGMDKKQIEADISIGDNPSQFSRTIHFKGTRRRYLREGSYEFSDQFIYRRWNQKKDESGFYDCNGGVDRFWKCLIRVRMRRDGRSG